MPNEYPCKKCKIKEYMQKRFDCHWFDNGDCPFECPYVKKEVKDNAE